MKDDELGVKAGQVIDGKYRVLKLLGRGGMGSVWLCDHLSLLARVAVKVIKPAIAQNRNSLARFMREAKAAAMLRSPHVVQILDHGKADDIAYIAMELLEGQSLLQRLKRGGPLSPTMTSTVLTHVGRAIGKAHETGIIHRDLKPDNIFIIPNDDEILAKVLDFGIAKTGLFELNQTESPQTQTGALLGTPYYMSPEQATGQKDIDHRSDLWSIGVIAFECLTGKRPYRSDSLGELVLQICARPLPTPSALASVPTGFDAWFNKAQQRKPEDRFQTAKEMTRALRDVLRQPVVARVAAADTSAEAAGDRVQSEEAAQVTPMQVTPHVATDRNFPPGLEAPPTTEASMDAAADDGEGDVDAAGPSPKQIDQTVHSPVAPPLEALAESAATPGLETLDPLASTTPPGRHRTVVVGLGLGAIAVVLVVLIAGQLIPTSATPTNGNSTQTASRSAAASTSAAAPSASPTPSSNAPTKADPSATASLSRTSVATAKAATPPTPRPTGTPKAAGTPKATAKPTATTTPTPALTKTPDDPLGI